MRCKMYITRHIEQVVERMARRKPILVITGARQVGKSTMLKATKKDVRYLALNTPMVKQSAKENPSSFFDIYRPPIIVDEIQQATELFDYIKETVDESGELGSFFLTGSQSLKLMRGITESLAGRAGVIKMLGLSLRELTNNLDRKPFLPTTEYFQKINNQPIKNNFDWLVNIIHKGFFPELHKTPSSLSYWSDFYSSYYQTYIEKDIYDILNIQDEIAFSRFVRATASLTGCLLNYTTLAQMCDKDVKTVKAWMSALESSGLVYLLQPYHNNYGKRLTKTPKLYFLDTGFACWLLGWNTPEQLFNGAMWGHIFESYVFTEILKSYYNDGIVNPPLYFYRDFDKTEIDIVILQGDTLYPIEIKTTSDPTKQMTKSFIKISSIPGKSLGTGTIICLAKQVLPLNSNVFILPTQLL